MSRNFKLTIAYDGSGFAGWQVQPGQPTIQQSLQTALLEVTGEQVNVIGSGRTDAGVHAVAQVASCVCRRWNHGAADLVRALNSKLPDTIVVRNASEVVEDFHAIRDATGKRYRYQLQIGGIRDVFEYRFRWHVKAALDTEAMRAAAGELVGEHDFASFQAAGSDRKTTVRHVRACDLIEQPTDLPDRTHLAIEVEANGFLYNMVRNIVGTLVDVGLGKREPESMSAILAARDRDAAGPTAPAHGLSLMRVDYER